MHNPLHGTEHEVISGEKRLVWNDPTYGCHDHSHLETLCMDRAYCIVLTRISCNEFSKDIWIKWCNLPIAKYELFAWGMCKETEAKEILEISEYLTDFLHKMITGFTTTPINHHIAV